MYLFLTQNMATFNDRIITHGETRQATISVKPKIYTKDTHSISRDQIDSDALFVLDRLTEAGHTAYLVGGCVRDLLLQHKPKDYDVSTSARPEEIRPLFRSCFLIGRRFRLAHVRFAKKIIEVATFRKGDNEDDSLIVADNDWGDEAEDVFRRDFTINGLFYNAKNETIIDYVKGVEDAKNFYIRSIGNPHVRFKQDPVRMIRLIKFRARFGLEIDPEAKHALIECRSEILKSAKARVLEEILRMLESGSSEKFFKLMADFGFLQILLPAISEYLETEYGVEIYRFLAEMDRLIKTSELEQIPRPVLLAGIAFPMLHTRLLKLQAGQTHPMHLGEIHLEAQSMNHEFFGPFLQIPKKLSAALTTITTSQFRFTPMIKKRKTSQKIPGSPDFPLALEFFKYRAQIEPGLQNLYDEWVFFWRKHQKRKVRRR